MREEQWFPRMADIPGLRFAGSPGVDRESLPEAHARPYHESGGLWWRDSGGSLTSASPAHFRAFADLSLMTCDDLVRWVWEGLELPGLAPDYHHLMQSAALQLWKLRRSDPHGLDSVEAFSYLDLSLIEAVPAAVSVDDADTARGFVWLAAVDLLITMLQREGSLREALAVSRRAQQFGENYQRPDLESKVAALDAERA